MLFSEPNDLLVQRFNSSCPMTIRGIHVWQYQSTRQESIHQLFDFGNRLSILSIFIPLHPLMPTFENYVVFHDTITEATSRWCNGGAIFFL